MNKVAITGNTYPVKERIKALGGRWDGDQKAWMVPAANADAARALIASAPQGKKTGGKSSYRRSDGGKWTGCSCGSREGVSRASDCWTCRHDAE
jgi:hypothetical protein